MGTDIHGVWQKRVGEGWQDIESEYDQDRHYQLFAILAGVRNGRGFANVETGEPVTPIAEPRGLPQDFEIRDHEYHPIADIQHQTARRRGYTEDAQVWMGDHSFSWLSGEEMLAYEISKVRQKGVISRAEFFEHKKGTRPCSYSGGISGAGIVVIDETTDLPESWTRDMLDENWTHIRVSWIQDLKEECGYFFDEVKRLVDLYGEIRFVFGFDS